MAQSFDGEFEFAANSASLKTNEFATKSIWMMNSKDLQKVYFC
jgi:hypothetical protein